MTNQTVQDSDIEVTVLSYQYSPGDEWMSVSGQLLIDGAPWVKFNNTVEVAEIADEVEALRLAIGKSIVAKAHKLGEDHEFKG